MKIIQIFDQGQLFGENVLDIEESALLEQFMSGVKTVAAISLALNYPTLPSVMHSLVNSYKNLLAVALATDITFEGAEKAKAYLENPEAFAVAAAPAAAAAASADAPKAEEKKEEEEESDDDMG
jgi:large subunit ribosomal protein LP0